VTVHDFVTAALNRDQIRTSILVLDRLFIERDQRYLSGWCDDNASVVAGAPVRLVETIRKHAFGGQAEAAPIWRLRRAVELLELRFDYTEQLGARDQVVQDAGGGEGGEEVLYQMQLAGTAPPGGLYEREWNDDRIADHTGLAPGDVYGIRMAIPWVRPDDRPRVRRRRDAAAMPPTAAARVLFLDSAGNPNTGLPYTVDDLVLALEEIEGGAREDAAAWIETTLQVGAARLDTDGRPRTVTAIARALGFSREWTYRLLTRFEADRPAGGRGQPTKLTPEILALLRGANPRRFDRGSWYAWIAAWCWPEAKGRPTPRTLKGWRERGLLDLGAGRATAFRDFAEAVTALVAAAPGDAPSLPTAEELAAVAGFPDRAAAVNLGVTPDQLTAAREAVERTA
jgi:hypothetical protein